MKPSHKSGLAARESPMRQPRLDGPRRIRRESERGSAVLVVFVLLLIGLSLAIGNNVALDRLHKELHLIDRKQQTRLLRASETNSTEAVAVPASSIVAPSKTEDRNP